MLATSNALPFSEPKALIVRPLICTERPLKRMKSNINKWHLVMRSTFNLRFILPRCLKWVARLHFKVQGKLNRYLSVNRRSDMLQASVLHYIFREATLSSGSSGLMMSSFMLRISSLRKWISGNWKEKIEYDKQDPSRPCIFGFHKMVGLPGHLSAASNVKGIYADSFGGNGRRLPLNLPLSELI